MTQRNNSGEVPLKVHNNNPADVRDAAALLRTVGYRNILSKEVVDNLTRSRKVKPRIAPIKRMKNESQLE